MMRWVGGASVVVLCVGVCVGVCGCSPTLTRAGATVRVGKTPPEGLQCSELGIVYGTGSGAGYTTAQEKLEAAQNDLRNQTAALGGNFVIMDAAAGDPSSFTLSGRALDCTEALLGATPVENVSSSWPDEPKTGPAASATPPAPSAAAPTAAPTVEQRLRVLDDLRAKGLVTEPEYQQRRKEILDSI